jgi:pilus assembly protein CpaB
MEVKTVPVVVATSEIPRGVVISEKQVAVTQWPRTLKPVGAISDIHDVVGRVTLASQPAGHPLWGSELTPKDVKGGLAAIVPDGMRAFTILTPTVASGVAGFVLPGNKVDVYLTIACPNPFTVALLENVEILAVDQQLETAADRKLDAKGLKSVTLLVTPEQGARLSLGQKKGDLQLALRNPMDTLPVAVHPITLSDLNLPSQLLAQATGQPWPPAKDKESDSELKPEVVPEVKPEPMTMTIRTMRGNQMGTLVWRRLP